MPAQAHPRLFCLAAESPANTDLAILDVISNIICAGMMMGGRGVDAATLKDFLGSVLDCVAPQARCSRDACAYTRVQ
jgi:hypothetical protein